MKYRKLLLFGVPILIIVAIAAIFALGIKWVGHTDLEIRFVVIDAKTGQPVPNATVHVRLESEGFCDPSDSQEFTIATDENGQAKHVSTNCMCFGSKGVVEDTFAVHLPWWRFHVAADGYSDMAPAFLDVPENARLVRRGKPFATISIPISLQRSTRL